MKRSFPFEERAEKEEACNSDIQSDLSEEDQSCQALAYQLKSRDVNSALNTLLKLSHDFQANYELGRGGDQIVEALVQLFDKTIGWSEGNGNGSSGRVSENVDEENPWAESNGNEWIKFCQIRLSSQRTQSYILPANMLTYSRNGNSKMDTLEAIIMIIRNLSFVAANLRFLAHSLGVLRILTGCLYFRNFIVTGRAGESDSVASNPSTSSANKSTNNLCLHAIQTFINLIPLIDFKAHKLFFDLALLANHNNSNNYTNAPDTDILDVSTISKYPSNRFDQNYGQASNLGWGGLYLAKKLEGSKVTGTSVDEVEKIPRGIVRDLVQMHVSAFLKIFPALTSILFVTSNRPVLIYSLELLTQLIDNPSNASLFRWIPNNVLHQIVQLLWVPRLGPDSVEYLDPTTNMVSRLTMLKLSNGYDATVDPELRDRALELLVKLTDLSDDLKKRVGQRKGSLSPNMYLYYAIIPSLSTRIGRGDTPHFAAKLLANLASIPENKYGILCVQEMIMAVASSDPSMSHLLYKGVILPNG